jgi:uncharacterized protein
MYSRSIKPQIQHWMNQHLVIIIYGPRQVGKTTLAKEIAKEYDDNYLYIDCEDYTFHEALNSRKLDQLKKIVGDNKLVVFDEAQRVKYIGASLKLLHDHLPDLKIIATGSSSFELANKVSEPLTGRNIKFELYPLAPKEIQGTDSIITLESKLQNLLRFGSYPKVLELGERESEIFLKTISSDYLYRDVLELGNVKKPMEFRNMVRTIAYLIGQLTTAHEIAKKIGTDRQTVERYLDLLEKAFIIKILRPLHRSHVREILHPFKIYFWDLGVRNSVIDDFKPIGMRDERDVGAIWENYCIIERIKKNLYGNNSNSGGENNPDYILGINKSYHFWRTNEPSPKEYDLIEERDGQFQVFEIKWAKSKAEKVKTYPVFFDTYKNSTLEVIHSENWTDWLV